MSALPQSLEQNPRLIAWLRFTADHRVTLITGKVEIGQGISTALIQIAADELDIAPSRFDLIAGDTGFGPNEGWTAGSLSIEVGGGAVRLVTAEIRHLAIAAAALALNAAPEEITVEDGGFSSPAGGRSDYWALGLDLDRLYVGLGEPKSPAGYRWVGNALPRRDFARKFMGGGYIHDLELPDMLHGRVIRPSRPGSRLTAIDRAAILALPGVVALVVDGDFVGLGAEREEQAIAAAQKAARLITWQLGPALPMIGDDGSWLRDLPDQPQPILAEEAAKAATQRRQASYSKPFLAHASIGPACGLARWRDGGLEVWSHSQGVYPLRGNLARTFGLGDEQVTVHHQDGAGCYGHNGADDAALDAALLARGCGRPVRLCWSREDELSWSPMGPAMLVELDAGLDDQGRIVDWRSDIRSFSHVARPGFGDGVNLLAAGEIAARLAPSPVRDLPAGPAGGGSRNGVPIYTLPGRNIVYHFIEQSPLRTSAMRGLGAFANLFAIESFIDELALVANRDPLQFRLDHLDDPRAVAVLQRVAEMADWRPGVPGSGDWGRGIGFGRYKNRGAYCALVVELVIDEHIRLAKVYAAVDCGLVVNPDGVKNQVEGGIIQAASWALKEQLRLDPEGVASRSWADYPILRFDEVPHIEIALIEPQGAPSLGVGECAAGPTAAAIANAVAHALGIRIRDLPITKDRIIAAV